MDRPDIHYARSGNVYVAYQAFGKRPFDLVVVPGALSNIGYGWEFESWQNFYGTLASFARILLFDKRGTGISDPVPSAPTVEERMDDVRAVMDAAGSERAALMGSLDGAAMAALFAATYPERTAALVLINPVVRGRWAADYPWGSREEAESAASVATWLGKQEAVEKFLAANMPGRSGDDEFARQMASYFRFCASPTTFMRMFEMSLAIDVREALSTIRSPTVVIHRSPPALADEKPAQRPSPSPPHRGEPLRRRANRGRPVCRLTPGDPPLWEVDQSETLALIQEFLTGAWEAGAWEPAEPDRVLATLLFTDIVGSTTHAAELGDARWRDLVHRHHALVRQQLARFRGREIDTAGDGFFASFDGPARAVRCARAIVSAIPELGLDVRAGLHTGECEIIDGKPGGFAVVVGARISSVAPSGEVFASSTVKDLVAGSGITFEDRGDHELNGVPGTWRLHAVVSV